MILGDTKKPSFKVNKNDNYNTPVEAWEFLLNNMQQEAKNSIIWCPFYHDGSMIENLKDLIMILLTFWGADGRTSRTLRVADADA